MPHEPWLIFFVCYRQIRRDSFFVIPKTTEVGFSKRRISFHKTTRIFDGVEQGLFNGCTMLVQWLFNGCSMLVQWLFNACHHALWSLVSAESMNAIRFLLRRGGDFAWNEWNGGKWKWNGGKWA